MRLLLKHASLKFGLDRLDETGEGAFVRRPVIYRRSVEEMDGRHAEKHTVRQKAAWTQPYFKRDVGFQHTVDRLQWGSFAERSSLF